VSSARADNDDDFSVAYLGLSRPGSGSVTCGSDLHPAPASRDDVSCEQSGLRLAWGRRPYVNASSKARYKGYNYQNKRRVTQNRPSIGSARARPPRLDRRLRRGAT
jgi:hypothetical protein